MIRDATAVEMLSEVDGCLAAIIKFRNIANGLWSIDETVQRIESASRGFERKSGGTL